MAKNGLREKTRIVSEGDECWFLSNKFWKFSLLEFVCKEMAKSEMTNTIHLAYFWLMVKREKQCQLYPPNLAMIMDACCVTSERTEENGDNHFHATTSPRSQAGKQLYPQCTNAIWMIDNSLHIHGLSRLKKKKNLIMIVQIIFNLLRRRRYSYIFILILIYSISLNWGFTK